MSIKLAYYCELERLLRKSLERVGDGLLKEDCVEVEMYIDFSEYGLAYESLVSILDKKHLALPEALVMAGRVMGLRG
jgi:hypothetical protein